jgi:tetratricopeptide (TPR) repeat protein
MHRNHLIVLLFPALIWSCASTPETTELDTTATEALVVMASAPARPERSIPDESLYPLLVAEFALRRRSYEVALDQYMSQAEVLQDPAISAHTTRLAKFMKREPEALAAAQLWVQVDPNNVEANNTLATLLVRRSRTVEAIPYVAIVARSGADTSFPMLLNGFRTLSPAQQGALMDGINALATEFPDDPQLLLTRALIHEELEQAQQALEILDLLFELEPYQQQAVLLEAKLLVEIGAKDPFKRMRAALDQKPDDSRLRLPYARLLTREDMDAAREQFEILSSQNPEEADLLFSLALINRETGDLLAAKGYLQNLLDISKREDEAHYYLGRIAEDQEDQQLAIEQYMQVKDGRDFFSANNRIGQILLEQGQLEQSQQYFTALRDRRPEQREPLYGLEAELLNSSEMWNASLSILNQGLNEFPDSANLLYSRSMLGEELGDLDMMENDLRTILEKDPNNATALNALGYTLANRTNRYEEARSLIAHALRIQPGDPAILDSMGWVFYKQGQYEQAIKYLREAFAKFPDPEVAAHLGEALWASGDRDGAMDIWDTALLQNPDHTILIATIKRLNVTTPEIQP